MDRDADFSAFAAARWSALVRSAVFLGCGVEEAEDLVQTTLLKCYGAWRRLERADNRDAYVYRVLLNAHRDSRRRHWWREQPTDLADDRRTTADAAEQVAITDSVERALGDLSPVNREVVVLRYYARLTEQQTADALGVPTGTVKSRLSRALTQLAANPHLTDHAEGGAG
jgi:RNA polymerase sigma-70 factor (sigma-E family)